MYQRKYAAVCNSSNRPVKYTVCQQEKPNQLSNRDDHGMVMVQLPNHVDEFPKIQFEQSMITEQGYREGDGCP